jgi:hypothetical protein
MWIIDPLRRELLGHVVAGHPGTVQAFMVSAASLKVSIEEATSIPLLLPAQQFPHFEEETRKPAEADGQLLSVAVHGPVDHSRAVSTSESRENEPFSSTMPATIPFGQQMFLGRQSIRFSGSRDPESTGTLGQQHDPDCGCGCGCNNCHSREVHPRNESNRQIYQEQSMAQLSFPTGKDETLQK